MSWRYFLNLEPMALSAAHKAADSMTESNFTGRFTDVDGLEPEPDIDAFASNLEQGFVAVFTLSAYLDAAVNTLICRVLGADRKDPLLRQNMEKRLAALFDGRREELDAIKAGPGGTQFQRLMKMRDALTHYKDSTHGTFASYPHLDQWIIGDAIDEPLGLFFTRPVIAKLIDAIVSLVEETAACFGLVVNPCASVVSSDASGEGESYFCAAEELEWVLDSAKTNRHTQST